MAGLAIRFVEVASREDLAALVEAHLAALAPGLSLLSRRFPAGRVLVDLLALDGQGHLALVLVGSGTDPALLLEALEAYGWCRENAGVLGGIFPETSIDAAAPPRLYLLAPRFSDDLRRTARSLDVPSPLLAECRVFEVSGTRGVCFEPVDGSGESSRLPGSRSSRSEDPARARALEFLRHLERLSFRDAFR